MSARGGRNINKPGLNRAQSCSAEAEGPVQGGPQSGGLFKGQRSLRHKRLGASQDQGGGIESPPPPPTGGFFGNLTKAVSGSISAVGTGVVQGTKAVGTGVVQVGLLF